MSTARTPTPADVAGLGRDEWDLLCASLCDIYAHASRVEDRRGRGNGLDAWRLNDEGTGIEGWQFRRLDGRFGDGQVADLKRNIELAKRQCLEAFSLPLVKFTAVLNIDPEPPHGGAAGEDERLHRVRQWAAANDVAFDFKGLNWVRTHLLLNPGLKPELFEDLAAATAEARDRVVAELRSGFAGQALRIGEGFDSLRRVIDENTRLEAALQAKVRKLADEARRHYERGHGLQSGDEYARAATSLDDALRLVEATDESQLQATILSLLAGVETVLGRLQSALGHGREALGLCDPDLDQELQLQTMGNLGFALGCNQEFEEAEALLVRVLRTYEERSNLGGIVNTLTHLTELCANAKDLEGAMDWGSRLGAPCQALVAVAGENEMSLSALGASAGALLLLWEQRGLRPALVDAAQMYSRTARVARESSMARVEVNARFQMAKCAWYLGEHGQAEVMFNDVIAAAEENYAGVAAHARINLGLMFARDDRPDDAIASFEDARRRYEAIGDLPGVQDALRGIEDVRAMKREQRSGEVR